MDERKRSEITEIRDMAARVSERTEDIDTSMKVYEMFGSINADMAKGIVIGLNMVLREL
uniref:Uncharacterized protein n=1 Tax=viral metagenome TaxID=1070528 RepID=A0A6H2A592_9ZZZZ